MLDDQLSRTFLRNRLASIVYIYIYIYLFIYITFQHYGMIYLTTIKNPSLVRIGKS